MQVFYLPEFDVFEAWRVQARACATAGIHPDSVMWRRSGEARSLFGEAAVQYPQPASVGADEPKLKVSRNFLATAELASCHSAQDVFDQLYRLLLRVMTSPSTMENLADRDVARLSVMTKSISRDTHKMKAFVRFKEAGVSETGRRQFASWFEPEHHIVDHVAGFFMRRFADMDWVIDSPKGCVSFVNSSLAFHPFIERPLPPQDDMDALWRTYYTNIFNPARLKMKAMRSEVPRRYWKNLPEASLISALARTAEQRFPSQGLILIPVINSGRSVSRCREDRRH